RNNSAVTSTAFVVKIDHVSAKGDAPLIVFLDPDTIYVDTAMDTTLRPLQPNQEHALQPRLRSRRGGPTPLAQDLSARAKAILYLDAVDLSEHTITTAGVFA